MALLRRMAPQNGRSCYEVVAGGSAAGRTLGAGDQIVVEGEPRDGQWVVLEPRGLGRPVLGRRVGARWVGPHGEPCHPDRWRCVGRVLGIVAGDVEVGLGWSGQLALFQAAA